MECNLPRIEDLYPVKLYLVSAAIISKNFGLTAWSRKVKATSHIHARQLAKEQICSGEYGRIDQISFSTWILEEFQALPPLE